MSRSSLLQRRWKNRETESDDTADTDETAVAGLTPQVHTGTTA